MNRSFVTPRDLLAIDPNPARIPVREIMRRFGVAARTAQDVRTLACRAPEVLDRQRKRLVGA